MKMGATAQMPETQVVPSPTPGLSMTQPLPFSFAPSSTQPRYMSSMPATQVGTHEPVAQSSSTAHSLQRSKSKGAFSTTVAQKSDVQPAASSQSTPKAPSVQIA